VVLADEGIQRRLQAPPSNGPPAFFYCRTAPISLQFENREQKLNDGIVLIPFLIFAARSEDNGSQSYTYTDKDSPGISLLKRIGADSKPAEFTTVNGHVYFSADDGTNGRALWKTDLREDGTELVPGSERTDPSFLTAYKKDLYFIAKGGSELWVSGGTPEKATILKTFGDSSLKTLDSGFIAYDDTLFHHRQCPVWDPALENRRHIWRDQDDQGDGAWRYRLQLSLPEGGI
jgi:ELWxxDGT repeat protein